MLNQLPVDLAPFFTLLGASEEERTLVRQGIVGFNAVLQGFVDSLKGSLPHGVRVHFIDAFGISLEIINHPQDFGLTNVTESALNLRTGEVVSNSNEYVFWDPVHPATVFYTPFAGSVLDAIVNDLLDEWHLVKSQGHGWSGPSD